MAYLQYIKEIASARQITIEQLAEKVGIKAQAIHLMVRPGSTRIETLEKIAETLGVPTMLFFDEKFNIDDFKKLVIRGHHNPFALYGSSNIYEIAKNEASYDAEKVLKIKDDLITSLQQQVDDLRADKEDWKERNHELRKRIRELENQQKSQI